MTLRTRVRPGPLPAMVRVLLALSAFGLALADGHKWI